VRSRAGAKPLIALAKNPDAKLRAEAVRTLGTLLAPEFMALITRLVGPKTELPDASAVLGKSTFDAAIQALRDAGGDASPSVSLEAGKALDAMRTKQ
jgi:hypothetical protein